MQKSKLIDGKALRDKIVARLKAKVEKLALKPKLVIIFVGENEASARYIRQKEKAAAEIGALVEVKRFPKTISKSALIDQIQALNQDKRVNGIIVQLPLPRQLNQGEITQVVDPKKDVDGLTENSEFRQATPLGVLELLHKYKVPLKGQTAVVIGQSILVGAPLADMLEEEGAKVIVIDINTPPPIDPLVQKGDIVVSAVGKAGLVTGAMIKKGAVVIDVGINRDPETGKLVGDVDFEKVSKKASLITPVPGGVGPMTVAMLLSNLVKAATS